MNYVDVISQPLSKRSVRRASGMGEEESIHFIKYMGSKRNLLAFVSPVVRGIVPHGGLLLDLFAGTHAVGYAAKEHCLVWGNDIQAYSAPIGETLLIADPKHIANSDVASQVLPSACAMYEASSRLFQQWLKIERKVSWLAAEGLEDEAYSLYKDYAARLTSSMPPLGETSLLEPRLRMEVQAVLEGHRPEVPIMAATYWADTYFSLDQCLWLDALRVAIDNVEDPQLKSVALACLLHAATYCSIGSGHFAQFHKAHSKKKFLQRLPYRKRSVTTYWLQKLEEVRSRLKPSIGPNRVTTLDFRTTLEQLGTVDAIYADPPYSFVHYSRFYHALETLTRYDSPGIEFDGRYRPARLRHQSPFSLRSKMKGAFEDVLRAGKEFGIPIVWSYSKSALMPFEELLKMCRNYYPSTEVHESAYQHNTMGRAGDKTVDVEEVLIVCV